MSRLSLIRFVAIGLLSVAPGVAVAQRPVPQTIVWDERGLPTQDGSGTRLPTAGRREARLFRTAVEHLEAGRADEAVVYFQTILDADADGFFEVDGTTGRLVSLRAEAARRLGGLDAEGRQAYELRYGAVATGLLKEAWEDADAAKLAEVVRRFPVTDAGSEAAFRLAALHLDRGETLAAAARLERLRTSGTGGQATSGTPTDGQATRGTLLFRLAACYARLGDSKRRDAVLDELAALDGELMLGGRAVAATDRATLAEALARVGRRPTAHGAEASEVAWAANGLPDPFLAPDVVGSTTETRLHQWAAQTELIELAAGHAAAPSARPIAAAGSLFFRTPANVVALDAATGERRWRSLADPLCWDYLMGTVPETPAGEQGARSFVGQRLWSDATWGTLATDGRLVFAVEETGSAVPLPPLPGSEAGQAVPEPVLPMTFNRLVAYDAATARRLWEAGGPSDEGSSLAGTFFLGPPVPAGGHWFALGEAGGVTQLVAIDPSDTSGVLWTQPVAEHDATIDRDVPRRTAGLAPSVVGGLLVCPVGSGLVVAVDPATRSLLWAFGPSVASDPRDDQEADASRSPEVVATDRILLIGSRDGVVSAVDPLDGSLDWEATLPGSLWTIAVDDAAAYVQMATGVVAVGLGDGVLAWDAPAAIGPPSGRGVVVGERLYIPLADATLAVLDTATGRAVAVHKTPRDEPLGNLIVVGGTLVSQSATRIVAMPLPE